MRDLKTSACHKAEAYPPLTPMQQNCLPKNIQGGKNIEIQLWFMFCPPTSVPAAVDVNSNLSSCNRLITQGAESLNILMLIWL